jgi:hypothetical protein
MKAINYYTESTKQWLARMQQTRTVRLIMLSIMVFLGLILIVKGGHTFWHWQKSVAQMNEQFIPAGWAQVATTVNGVLQLAIGMALVVGLRFAKFRGGALAAACLLLFVYAAYSRIVQIKQLVAVAPCACIGWWEGMSWSSVLRTNIILLGVATLVWLGYTYKEERRSATL